MKKNLLKLLLIVLSIYIVCPIVQADNIKIAHSAAKHYFRSQKNGNETTNIKYKTTVTPQYPKKQQTSQPEQQAQQVKRTTQRPNLQVQSQTIQQVPQQQNQTLALSQIKIPEGTHIQVKAIGDIHKNHLDTNMKIYFKTTQEVKSKDGVTLIKAGSPVIAQLSYDNPQKPKNIKLINLNVQAIDGGVIPLTPESCTRLPLTLLNKDNGTFLFEGTRLMLYTATDVYVKKI